MPTIEDVFDMIEQSGNLADFDGAIPEERIRQAEMTLGLRFPPSYRQFVARYGCGNVGSEELFGLPRRGDGGVPSAVWSTLEYRRDGLPPLLIVIQDAGNDWISCLDMSQMSDKGEAPVVQWEPGLTEAEQDLTPVSPSFVDFAVERLQRVLKP